MVYTRFIEIGRVVLVLEGEFKNKIAVVIDVIDSNRALIDGPGLGVPRHAANFKNLAVTDLTVKIAAGARAGPVEKAIKKADVATKWDATPWAKKIVAKSKRASLNDFERFQVKVNKQKRARIVRTEFRKLKKSA